MSARSGPTCVGERGGAIAGMELFGDGAAADNFAAFENDGFEAALGEIESGDECVVTAADDDYALSDGHGQFFSLSGAMVESDGALATSSAVSGAALRASVTDGTSWLTTGAGGVGLRSGMRRLILLRLRAVRCDWFRTIGTRARKRISSTL